MNAASIRIGPSRFVVTVDSAAGRKLESCRSSGSMMPAMLISTLTSGYLLDTMS
jgi:hypothetical protein